MCYNGWLKIIEVFNLARKEKKKNESGRLQKEGLDPPVPHCGADEEVVSRKRPSKPERGCQEGRQLPPLQKEVDVVLGRSRESRLGITTT